MSTVTNPGLPSISEELFPADKANCCGQKGIEMRGTTLGFCALGLSIEVPLSSFPPAAHSVLSQSCVFPSTSKTSPDPGWVPALTLVSVSSF